MRSGRLGRHGEELGEHLDGGIGPSYARSSCCFLASLGSSVVSAMPSFLSFVSRARSAGFTLDAGWAAMRLLWRITGPVTSSARCGTEVVVEAVSGGVDSTATGGGARMESQRRWRLAVCGEDGGGSELWCGGESSKPGGRWVSSASESSIGEAMVALAAAVSGSTGCSGRASVPHSVPGPNAEGPS
jgi:hypothetical protein